jgi:hypothetical protein
MKGRVVLFGGLMWVAAGANAQGILSFDDIPIEREPTVEVNMGPEMITLLAGAAQVPGGAPGTGPLDGITNVRVLVYEDIQEDMQAVVEFVESTGTRLEGDGWHAVVRVRDGDEQVRVYMRPGTAGTLAGVTVMVMDSGGGAGAGEAVFLNVAGTIHPAQLGQIASSMGMHGMFRGVPVIPPAALDASQN